MPSAMPWGTVHAPARLPPLPQPNRSRIVLFDSFSRLCITQVGAGATARVLVADCVYEACVQLKLLQAAAVLRVLPGLTSAFPLVCLASPPFFAVWPPAAQAQRVAGAD